MAYTNLVKKRAAELRWYYKNKAKILQYKQHARKLRVEYIQRLKNVPCKDCGIQYPHYVMDFDHRKNNSKLETINRLASTRYGWKILKEEVEKCDVVCANCHRIRTYNRRIKAEYTQIHITGNLNFDTFRKSKL